MKLKLKAGTTGRIVRVFVRDSSNAVGAGLTGLVYNTANLVAYYSRVGASSATAISLVTATLGTWTSGGFKELDATNMPGVYELHLPDAALATSATAVHLMLKGATNMVPTPIEIELDAFDYQSATVIAGSVTDKTGYGLTAAYDAAKTAAPTAAQNATQVRTELGTELARIDQPISSRLASVSYTAPNNVGINSALTAATAAATSAASVDSKLTSERLALIDGVAQETAATSNLEDMLAAIVAASSSSIIVAPLSATVPTSTIQASGTTQGFRYCALPTGPIAILSAGQPLSLTGSTVLMFCVDVNNPGITFTLKSTSGELEIDNHKISVIYTPQISGRFQRNTYRKPPNENVWQKIEYGFWDIEDGPNPAELA